MNGEKDSLCLVMPAYNEEETIERVIRDWYPAVASRGPDSELVINISGSRDRTEEKILALRAAFPRIRILRDSQNSYGEKVLDLFEYAAASGAEFVFQTDSDGQTDPAEFDAFWDIRYKYDAVIGARSSRKDGTGRLFVERVVTMLVAIFFRVRVPDANAPFRLIRRKLLSDYLKIVPRSYSMPNILFTALFASRGEKLCFREISFGKRAAGTNKMNYKKIFASGMESLRTFAELGRKYRCGT